MTQLTNRRARLALLAIPAAGAIILAGCTAGSEVPTEGVASGFSFTFPKANPDETFYEDIVAEYTKETGAEVELLPISGDNYQTQLPTQLQGGNAADVFLIVPGAGQAVSAGALAQAGLLEPLGQASIDIIPKGSEGLFSYDGTVYAQPPALSPNGIVWNPEQAKAAGISEYPETFDDLLDACTTARDGGTTFAVLAGSLPFNTGFTAQALSATRVYAETPDWNDQRSAGDVTFADSDGWRAVLEDFIKMNEGGCFQDGAAGGTFDAITGGLIGKTALGAFIPGGAAASLGAAGGIPLEVRDLPGSKGNDRWIIASTLFAFASNASSDAPTKAAVQKFLDWLTVPEHAVEFANLSGQVPIIGAGDGDLLPQFAPIGDLIASGSFSSEPNVEWPNPSVYDALGVGMQGLITGQTTVDGVLASLDAAWDQ